MQKKKQLSSSLISELKNLKIGVIPNEKFRFFISPVNLTANGPAHLGHAGGPFLRMDVLGRHLTRLGYDVKSSLSTDGYENHVQVKALEKKVTPIELARSSQLLIKNGLGNLYINYNNFEDTTDPKILQKFKMIARQLQHSLEKGGRVSFINEKMPIDDYLPEASPIEDKFCIGGWLSATCPSCGGAAGSYFCEGCGYHFSPKNAVNPKSKRGNIVDWKDSCSAFIDLDFNGELEQLWSDMRIEKPFYDLAKKFISVEKPNMRLTVPSSSGINWKNSYFIDQQTFFSYSSLLYAHHLLCGILTKESYMGKNPFEKNSEIILIGATGIDNTVPVLAGVSGCALSQDEYRPFDFIFFNYFLLLEGEKFSTSRNHVIWTTDIEKVTGLNREVLRIFLCEICPEDQESNFIVQEFIDFHNSTVELINHSFDHMKSYLDIEKNKIYEIDIKMLDELNNLFATQSNSLHLDRLRISDSVTPLFNWIKRSLKVHTANESYTWLKGFSLLAAPIMPHIADKIWKYLGCDGKFYSKDFLEISVVHNSKLPKLDGKKLTVSDINQILNLGAFKKSN